MKACFQPLGVILPVNDWGHDLAVPYDERVRGHLIHVVGSLCSPQNVSIVALDGLNVAPGFPNSAIIA